LAPAHIKASLAFARVRVIFHLVMHVKKTDQILLWLYAYVYAWLVMIFGSLRRERMSHDNGITSKGVVHVFDHLTITPHDFFEPGRSFSCRLRHASVSYMDDTIIQVRAASLKFADSRYESPLDLEMNTGTISLFWSARNFIEFAQCREKTNGTAFVRFYDKYPRGLDAAWDGIRKDPTSFAEMYYHSQCAQLFIGKDGVRRYAKFRLIPFDRCPETGLVNRRDFNGLWSEEVAPGQTRSPNYLKHEFIERMRKAKVCYILQIQLHTPVPGESDEIFNCNVEWDPETHPYLDVATVELDTVLSLDENNMMRFSVGHAPPSLALLPAFSVDDYNSVNYMRVRSGIAKYFRLVVYKLRGMPKPVPERQTSEE
jgi:catalase